MPMEAEIREMLLQAKKAGGGQEAPWLGLPAERWPLSLRRNPAESSGRGFRPADGESRRR